MITFSPPTNSRRSPTIVTQQNCVQRLKQSSPVTTKARASGFAPIATDYSRQGTRAAAYLDGRARGWPGDHTPHREAGGDSGAMAKCARDRSKVLRTLGNTFR